MALLGMLKLVPIRYWLALGVVIGLVLGIQHYGHTRYKAGIAHEQAVELAAHNSVQANLDVLAKQPAPYVEQYNALNAALSIPMPTHSSTATPCAPASSEILKKVHEHNHAK
jgi:hypothetical protein